MILARDIRYFRAIIRHPAELTYCTKCCTNTFAIGWIKSEFYSSLYHVHVRVCVYASLFLSLSLCAYVKAISSPKKTTFPRLFPRFQSKIAAARVNKHRSARVNSRLQEFLCLSVYSLYSLSHLYPFVRRFLGRLSQWYNMTIFTTRQ